ncbi:hypothetical protein GPECTOR_7g1093 [Gonium pectorale]|uniref:Uncharacterized protein n=1 Tax=Gonium pectorale TaxID=33097 RepID=A0A150GV42_GONPE|nr:hypothetical protein GPECTOR_7g1093 [Gonium pectorale]|eukprot:KXZ53200.1 hypothetical protein GPECTOR_7g1093 [Gonium pectorale]
MLGLEDPRKVVVRAAKSSGVDSFASDAQAAAKRAFNQAKGKWDSFSREQRLEERARDAVKKASASAQVAGEEAKDKARRVFVQLDSEYGLTSKAAKAARRAEEVARDVDQNYGVRRRVRSARDYVARNWPTWQRQLDEFTTTWYGKAAVFAGICLLVSTPFFWSVLNVLLLLWWLSVPVLLLLANYAREQQEQRLRQQQEADAAEAARRAANPFADLFGRAAPGRANWGGAAAGAGRRGASGGSGVGGGGAGRGRYVQQDGPIIEAEWTSVDEGDETGRSNRRR